MAKREQLLIIEPPQELIFKGPFNEAVTSIIKLTNPTPKKIAFKIKTTTPKRYCVKPNFGYIEPLKEVAISITLQPFDYNPEEKYKHKFMVQSVIVPDPPNDEISWEKLTHDDCMNSKLVCVFQIPKSLNSSIANDANLKREHVSSVTMSSTGAAVGGSCTDFSDQQEITSMGSKVSAEGDVDLNENIKVSKLQLELQNLKNENSMLREEQRKWQKERMQLKEDMLRQSRKTTSPQLNQPMAASLLDATDSENGLIQMHQLIVAIVIALIGVILGKYIL